MGNNPGKSVSFSTVEVREYDRILGAHPHIPVSLSIGWKYQENEGIALEDFKRNDRRKEELHTMMTERCTLLLYYGFSLQEMKDSEIYREEKPLMQHRMFGGRTRGRGLVVKLGQKMRHIIHKTK